MSAASVALSPGCQIGRLQVRQLGMALAIGMAALPNVATFTASSVAPEPPASAAADVAKAYGNLPVRFEANQGQTDARVRFLVRTGGATVFLTPQEAVWSLPDERDGTTAATVRVGLAGANASPRVVGTGALPGVSNYLIGKDASKWHTNVPSYGSVRYQGVYPGIDEVYHAGGGGMEYDFEVAPGANPAAIAIAVAGAGKPVIDGKGDLVVTTAAGEMRQRRPSLYQRVGDEHRAVEGHFAGRPDGTVGFAVGAYDRARLLVIDPVLSYSTFLGGSGDDYAKGIALDSSNNAYVTGFTSSSSFPVTSGSFQTTCAKCTSGVQNAFVTKLNPTGSAMVYSTYIGGTTGYDKGNSIAVDSSGNAYVAGSASSTDFPTPNGYKTTCGTTSTPCTTSFSSPTDTFLAKLGPTGAALLYGTYVGGSGGASVGGVALGAAGVAFVSGATPAADFLTVNPGTSAPYQSAPGGGQDQYLVKVGTNGSGGGPSLLYSTLLGGSADDQAVGVAVDPAAPDVAYVGGQTVSANFPTTAGAFQSGLGGGVQSGTMSKLDTTLGSSGLLYSTYLGGSNSGTQLSGLTVKNAVVYVAGQTGSSTYPVNGGSAAYQSAISGAGAQNLVVSKIDTTTTGSAALLYSSYLGGGTSTGNFARGIAVDAAGLITLTGNANAGFPVVHPLEQFPAGGGTAVVARLDPTAGTAGLVYSTPIGGTGDSGYGVAVDSAAPSDAYVAGATSNSTFPTTSGAFQNSFGGGTKDGFVTKLGPGTTPVVNAISVPGGPFTGGTPVTVTGSGFTGATAVNFGAVAAPYTVTSDTQITTTSPCPAAGNPSPCPDSALGTAAASTVHVTVTVNGAASTGGAADAFVYGEGQSAQAASCPVCNLGSDAAVTLPDGRILDTQSGGDHYTDGVAVHNLNVFTSGTAVAHQRTFTAADVGKRLSASIVRNKSTVYLFPPATTIKAFTNSNTVTLSNSASTDATGASFTVSNNVTELYSPATDTWTASGSCGACGAANYNDGGMTLTLLSSGLVLAAGGSDPTGNDQAYGRDGAVPEAFLFDPSKGSWSSTGALTTPRKAATATLLNNGDVLVAGGDKNGAPSSTDVDPYASAELYNPAAGSFASTGSMTNKRASASATLLSSGSVLVTGGVIDGSRTGVAGSPATATAELYNPGTASWTSAGSMNTARWKHTVTTLPSSGACGNNCGKVLVANGLSGYTNSIPPAPAQDALLSAELYSPATNTWSYTAAPSVRRFGGQASLLPTGRVLVINGSATVAERYDPAVETWRSAGLSPGSDICCALLIGAGPASACGTNCGKVFYLTGNGATGYYTPRPVVSSVAPTSGAGFGGSTVTITGTGLASVNQVRFGSDMSATAAAVPDPTTPDTKLTAVTPGELGNGAAGSTVDTTVSSSGGVSSISTADQYTYGTFGSLQVTTSPSLASQITVDSVYRDTTAVANVKIAAGSHTVCFREMPGYLPVSCQNVTVTAGQTATAQGMFVQKGTLSVTSNQPGGSILVGPASTPQGSNVTNRDDSGIITDLAVGSYDVCFGKILNQKPPGCQTVNVTAGATTSVIGTYTSSLGALGDDPTLGSLKVSTSPASLGSQITVDSTPRNTDAIKNLKIAAGTHTVCVREVTGYLLPPCQTVTVIASQNTSITVTFVAKGTLTVTETPSGVGGTIFVNGTPRDDGGMSTDVPVGTSQVCFGAVSGHVTPACRSVTITGGQTTSTAGAY